MNIGNFYKVEEYNPEIRKLKLSLLYISNLKKVKLTEKIDYLNLNIKWCKNQQ